MNIGAFIIGDEILSGKREDRHFAQLRSILSARGLSLSWLTILGDDRRRCVDALRASFASPDLIFSFGGIGATPDDHTRQAAAEALGRPLVLHPEAHRLIAERSAAMGQPLTDGRLKMGEFPDGAEIIPNPVNQIPGFRVGHHHFVPGFPSMAWPMVEWVLDQHYGHLFRSHAEEDHAIRVQGLYEAMVTPLLEELTQANPEMAIYSLPAAPLPGQVLAERLLELGIKAPADVSAERFEAAVARLREGVVALGGIVRSEERVRR